MSGEHGTRFLIIDDHPLFREALQSAVQLEYPDVETVEARSVAEALELLAESRPYDLALLDLSIPGVHGFEGLLQLRTRHPRLPVVIVSGHEEPRGPHVRHDVDVPAARPVRLRGVKPLAEVHPGVGELHVDGAEKVLDRLDQSRDPVLARRVPGYQRAADLLRDAVGPFPIEVGDDDPGTQGGHPSSERRADAAGGAGHDDDAVLHREALGERGARPGCRHIRPHR